MEEADMWYYCRCETAIYSQAKSLLECINAEDPLDELRRTGMYFQYYAIFIVSLSCCYWGFPLILIPFFYLRAYHGNRTTTEIDYWLAKWDVVEKHNLLQSEYADIAAGLLSQAEMKEFFHKLGASGTGSLMLTPQTNIFKDFDTGPAPPDEGNLFIYFGRNSNCENFRSWCKYNYFAHVISFLYFGIVFFALYRFTLNLFWPYAYLCMAGGVVIFMGWNFTCGWHFTFCALGNSIQDDYFHFNEDLGKWEFRLRRKLVEKRRSSIRSEIERSSEYRNSKKGGLMDDDDEDGAMKRGGGKGYGKGGDKGKGKKGGKKGKGKGKGGDDDNANEADEGKKDDAPAGKGKGKGGKPGKKGAAPAAEVAPEAPAAADAPAEEAAPAAEEGGKKGKKGKGKKGK